MADPVLQSCKSCLCPAVTPPALLRTMSVISPTGTVLNSFFIKGFLFFFFFFSTALILVCMTEKMSQASLSSFAHWEEHGSSPEVSLTGNLDN